MQKFVEFNDVAESYILIVRLQHTFTNFMVLSPDDQLERFRQNISKIHTFWKVVTSLFKNCGQKCTKKKP